MVGQLEAKLTEDLRFVVGVGVFQDQGDVGELVHDGLDLCFAHPGTRRSGTRAELAAGADSIDDMGLLRHSAMETVFGGVPTPSTLGSFLRSFTWGNVSQLGKAHREFLANLARQAALLPGAQPLAT